MFKLNFVLHSSNHTQKKFGIFAITTKFLINPYIIQSLFDFGLFSFQSLDCFFLLEKNKTNKNLVYFFKEKLVKYDSFMSKFVTGYFILIIKIMMFDKRKRT